MVSKRKMARVMPKRNPIAKVGGEALILPNHSGDHTKGTKINAPINPKDLVNKEYVDANAGVTDHTLLSNIGTNTHAQIDSHISNTSNPHSVTLAQVGGTTNHTALSNIGTNTHAQIDTHLEDSNVHVPSMTAGSVAFHNGTILSQDNSNFFWDNTNNRLGIGTSIPKAILHSKLSGTSTPSLSTQTNLLLENSGGLNQAILTMLSSGLSRSKINFGKASTEFLGGIRYENSNNELSFWTNALKRISVGGTGNIGIGTASPTTQLDVNGTFSCGVAAIGDNSALASSAAPTADQEIANKKYVDDQRPVSIIGGASDVSFLASRYMGPFGAGLNATEGVVRVWSFPVAGTINNFRARVNVAPGGSSQWTCTIRVSGTNTILSGNILGTATTTSDTGAVSVAAGDTITCFFDETVAGAASTQAAWSCTFIPT